MIHERYVNVEVAQILRDKGFDEPCRSYYLNYGKRYSRCAVEITNKDLTSDQLLRPTQAMVCAWLRTKEIDIVVFHEKLPESCYWARIEKYPYVEHQQEPEYETYEDCLDAAIEYVVKNLI